MNIRLKLTIQFVLLSAGILLLFSLIIYSLSERHREQEFFFRLSTRALTTAKLLITVDEINQNLLDIIEKNSVRSLFEERIEIYNEKNQLIYAHQYQKKDTTAVFPTNLIARTRQNRLLKTNLGNNECVGLLYRDRRFGTFVVLATAEDRYGWEQIRALKNVLWQGFLIGLVIIFVAGLFFSQRVLMPLVQMNETIGRITAGNLSERIPVENAQDELGTLASNFNQMLSRLEAAFAIQQQFVSSASHELRTPLMALSSQIQLILSKTRQPGEYQQTLHSLQEDTQRLIALSNGLLILAQSNLDKQKRLFNPIRVDELILDIQNELLKVHADYHFSVEYAQVPEDDALLSVQGNETLLRTALANLMENGCKFSMDKTVRIHLRSSPPYLLITFKDQGIGIPLAEQEYIFRPFYRASNAQQQVQGNGIGLALSRRIIELHDGTLSVESTPNQGSTFWVRLPLME